MTAIEAMVYCLGWIGDVMEDGEFHSQTVYDRHGDPHWFAIDRGVPQLCSESSRPFAEQLQPYSMHKLNDGATECSTS